VLKKLFSFFYSQVIGALQVQNYALFVSHKHPDGHVSLRTIPTPFSYASFNFYSFFSTISFFRYIGSFQCLFGSKERTSWGTFTTDTNIPNGCGGPCYDEPIREESNSYSRISMVGEPQKSILLARLRFKPDAMEPTSL
jgi:hypothetical protein